MKQQQNNSTRQSIAKFIHSLSEKNYADANSHLQKTVENKLINKIKQHKNINIFRHER
jgi:hypothetical protein